MLISTLITGPSDYRGLSNSTGLPTTSTGITSEERGDRRPTVRTFAQNTKVDQLPHLRFLHLYVAVVSV